MKPVMIVIIATKDRPNTLDRALKSVSNQTNLPDKVIVVSDCSGALFKDTSDIVSKYSKNIDIELIRNKRSENLSGAMNTALEILPDFFIPEQTVCAILDDDDEWTPDHLEKCLSVFDANDSDVIVSGLIRHESLNGQGVFLPIPTNPTVHDFLVGNPHIQGSNLFLRLSSFIECGGFDESLCSTTDRDLCIRLLNSSAKFGMTAYHTVHHWALSGKNRLSDPGSTRKKSGLIHFYQKFCNLMTKEEEIQFIQRAKQIFGIDIRLAETESAEMRKSNLLKTATCDKTEIFDYIPILIGFTASSFILADRLLNDLNTFLKNFDKGHCVLMCDNCFLNSDEFYKKYPCLNLKIISKNEIKSDIDSGNFGMCFDKKNSSSGISAGRTILHHYLYLKAREMPGCGIWILDDDIRLDFLDKSGSLTALTMKDFQSVAMELKNENASIGIGKITGDAPLPIHSTLRTQLLDIMYELRSRITFGSQNISFSNEKIFTSLTDTKHDYYYDFSEKHFDHLEVPDNHILINLTDSELIQSIADAVYGKSVTRPLIRTEDFSNGLDSYLGFPVIPRGGNTIVLNAEVLRDFPNISPQFNDLNARRGDTLWSLLNSHVGARKIVPLFLPVRQDRIPTGKIQNLDILASDFVGSALIKSLAEYYNAELSDKGKIPRRTSLLFGENDLEKIISSFERNLESRTRNMKLNAYRIRGLIRENKYLLTHEKFSSLDSTTYALEILNELENMYSLDNIDSVIRMMRTSVSDVRLFISNLYINSESYKQSLPEYFGPLAIKHSESVLRRMLKRNNIDDSKLIVIGHGKEGIIATDGHFAYKFFFWGATGFEDGNIEVLKKMIGKEFTHICKLHKIICSEGNLVLVMEYIFGDKYEGGYLDAIRNILLEIKNNGFVFTNFCPDNLVIKSENIKLADLGHSWFPYSEVEFHKMCIRAYLTYRFYFRDDLKELMYAAMFDESATELSDLDIFLKSLEKKSKKEMLDPAVIELCSNYNDFFDYGCGRGSIAEILAINGKNVVGYDIDSTVIEKNKRLNQVADYICSEDLMSVLKSDKKFECVICSLVLCCVGDSEAREIMNNIRKLVDNFGTVIIAICNPRFTFVEQTPLHIKLNLPSNADSSSHFIYHKKAYETGNIKTEYHRPLSWYENLFYCHGFSIVHVHEIESIDVKNLLPSSEFMLFQLNPLKLPFSQEED